MEGFAPIDHDEPIDPEAWIALVPADRMARGCFHAHMHARALSAGLDVSAFPLPVPGDMPLRAALALDVAYARLFHPREPLRAALRLVGRHRLAALMLSPAARLLFSFVPRRLPGLLCALPKFSRATGSLADVRIVEESETRVVLAVEGFVAFRETLFGMVDEAVAMCDSECTLSVKSHSAKSFELCVAWLPHDATSFGRYHRRT